MTTRPVQISFRNMGISPALEEEIVRERRGSNRSIPESSGAEYCWKYRTGIDDAAGPSRIVELGVGWSASADR